MAKHGAPLPKIMSPTEAPCQYTCHGAPGAQKAQAAMRHPRPIGERGEHASLAWHGPGILCSVRTERCSVCTDSCSVCTERCSDCTELFLPQNTHALPPFSPPPPPPSRTTRGGRAKPLQSSTQVDDQEIFRNSSLQRRELPQRVPKSPGGGSGDPPQNPQGSGHPSTDVHTLSKVHGLPKETRQKLGARPAPQ